MSDDDRFTGTRKVMEIGDSKAGIIPAPVAVEWGIGQGDELLIRETEDGDGIEIYPCGE
jgi:bifunctional DNA-binding transcriptional regulator/antitoxin component of YhaV-PrlF toxin-antitoxin module